MVISVTVITFAKNIKMPENRTYIQTGIRIPDEIINKLKFIAWKEADSMNGIAELAFKDYIGKWEKRNGTIKPEELKEYLSKRAAK